MEDMPQTSLPTKKHFEMMHGILLLITLVTMLLVLAIAYFTYGFVITFEQMRENQALHTNALGRIEQKIMEEKEEVVPLTTNTDVVIYENRDEGFRVVTAPGCEGIFEVKKMSQQSGERFTAVDTYAVYVPKAQDWPTDASLKNFFILTPTEYDRINLLAEKEKDSDSVTDIARVVNAPYFILRSGNYLIETRAVSDAPSARDLAAKQGGTCSFVAQQTPIVSP